MAMLDNQRVYLFTCLRSTNWFTAFPVSKMRDAAIIKNWRTLYPVCFGLCSRSDWPELNATLRRLVEYLFSRQTGRCAMCINMDNGIVEDNLSVLKAMWFPRWGIPTWGEDFRACCGKYRMSTAMYIIYIDTWNSENPILIIYIYIYTRSQVLHLNYSHYLTYIQIFMLKSILSAWPATTHQRPRKAWGSYDNKRRKNVSCRRISSQNGALMSLIWPVEFDQFIRCGTHIFAGYAAMHILYDYICNQRHVIEDI